MAGISSKAANITPNKEKTFQGQRFDDDLDLNWVQFKWRNHDPQIGRFIEIDPLASDYEHNSPYAFSENKVTGHIELEGLEAIPYPLPAPTVGPAIPIIGGYLIIKTIVDGASKYPELYGGIGNANIPLNAQAAQAKYRQSIVADQVRIEKINDLSEKAGELQGEIKSLEKSARSLEKNVKEHEQKLNDYKKDPDKYDNKGELQGVSPELREQKIDGRIKSLEKQIKKNQGELDKTSKQLDQKQKELQNVNEDIKKAKGT
jgi:RHS repeat-associated protein